MAKLTDDDIKTIEYTERWKEALWEAIDCVETQGRAGSMDGLKISETLFSRLSSQYKHLDFSGIPRLYEAFNNYRHHKLDGEELQTMAYAVVMVVNAAINEILARVGDKGTAHSADFRSLKWFGKTYSFTANQAPVVAMLFDHWENETPDVGGETLLLEVDHEDPPERLSVVFRGNPAWGMIIMPGETKSSYRLQPPGKNL